MHAVRCHSPGRTGGGGWRHGSPRPSSGARPKGQHITLNRDKCQAGVQGVMSGVTVRCECAYRPVHGRFVVDGQGLPRVDDGAQHAGGRGLLLGLPPHHTHSSTSEEDETWLTLPKVRYHEILGACPIGQYRPYILRSTSLREICMACRGMDSRGSTPPKVWVRLSAWHVAYPRGVPLDAIKARLLQRLEDLIERVVLQLHKHVHLWSEIHPVCIIFPSGTPESSAPSYVCQP